jgi:Subtilase family
MAPVHGGPGPDPALERLRVKVDSRLYAILSLGSERVRELRQRELAALRELAAELDRLKTSVQDRDELRRRRTAIWKRVAAPFTAGVHFPGEQRGLPADLREKKEPILSVFVETEVSATDLARHGFSMRSRTGSVCTAWVGWSNLMALGNLAGVQRVELARALRPSSPYPLTETGLEAMQTAATPHKGTGVIIGVADRYLDVLHQDFQQSGTQQTRILFLWDQCLTPQPNENPPSASAAGDETSNLTTGVEYTGAQIDATIQNAALGNYYVPVRHRPQRNGVGVSATPDSSEEDSHGTLVCGAAAGNGKAGQAAGLQATPIGAAPEANLIFVHLCPDDLSEWLQRPGPPVPTIALTETTHVANAATYVFARARRLGLPCVLNLSLGDSLGAHDGSSYLERRLDELVAGTGRALVVSAGNEQDAQAHLAGNAPPDPTFQFTVGPSDMLPAEIQIWSNAAMPLGIQLQGPGCALALAAGGAPVTLGAPGARQVCLISTVASPTHPANCISILLIPGTQAAAANAPGTYTVNLSANGVAGRFHVWISHLRGGVSLVQSTGGVTVAPPATAAHAIAAGAWSRLDGGQLTRASPGRRCSRISARRPTTTRRPRSSASTSRSTCRRIRPTSPRSTRGSLAPAPRRRWSVVRRR